MKTTAPIEISCLRCSEALNKSRTTLIFPFKSETKIPLLNGREMKTSYQTW